MLWLMVVAFAILLLCGFPAAFAMGIAGAIAIVGLPGVSPLLIPQRMFVSVNSFPLMAVPFFILAGELMNQGGITRRVVRFASTLVGHLPGGLAQVNIVTNIIMAGFSGSATADAVAIGSVMIPAMTEDGYPPGFAAGLTASASCIGPIIPPSISMVIYGSITGLSVGAMFLGGFMPGILIGLGLMALVLYYAEKHQWPRGKAATLREIRDGAREAALALLAPIVIIGGIVSGVFTATESGAIAALYCLLVGMFAYKEVKWNNLVDILVSAAIKTAVPMLVVAGASLFGWVLAREQFSTQVTQWMVTVSDNPNVIYFLVIVMLFIVGLFVEGGAAMLIFVPVLFPIGNQFGFDPVHFALVVIITILIGTVTPPVGLQLYVCSAIAKVPVSKVVVWPFVALMVAVLLIITYVPSLVTFIPGLVFGGA